eukprot:TRINITY_DN17738_c0_g1_i1.p1 TRINITY_DN17738_c0_g1~~TRINITY_DN17738_c0_g1_i1.p1  ORF type:complete len:467 (-),score=147.94 TRINITY_DN17738_c0_g1_i1:43-1443(-)
MIIPFKFLKSTPPCLSLVRNRAHMMSPIPPPPSVKGMTDWQADMFNTTALIPSIAVSQEHIGASRKFIEKYILKMFNLKPVQDCSLPNRKLVLLNPELVSQYRDLESVHSALEKMDISREHFLVRSYSLTVDNWTPHEILKAVLPPDQEGVSGFSIIGHIIHLNLKDHLDPYKSVIGNALLLTKNIKTVVNKSSTIDNTFRNFSMELLAGEKEFIVSVKESGCVFNFDFSLVYWNPRLSTEHERIIKMLGPRSVLFDACAGVGPFTVPSGKVCRVYSNDLNPESFKWLVENVKSNKKSSDNIECFNMDARDFIRNVAKKKMLDIWSDNVGKVENVHIVMNLPALAITFLDVFQGLFKDCQYLREKAAKVLPKVHVYGFSKSETPESDIQDRCEQYLGAKLDEDHLDGVFFVRNVAPNKDMMRASFSVPVEVCFDLDVPESDKENSDERSGVKRASSPDSCESSKKR